MRVERERVQNTQSDRRLPSRALEVREVEIERRDAEKAKQRVGTRFARVVELRLGDGEQQRRVERRFAAIEAASEEEEQRRRRHAGEDGRQPKSDLRHTE